jgi:hypothetical protein
MPSWMSSKCVLLDEQQVVSPTKLKQHVLTTLDLAKTRQKSHNNQFVLGEN